QLLSEALKKNPNDADALLENSELMLASRKYAEAARDLNQVLHLRPDSAQAHYIMARFHQVRDAVQNQRQELYEALRLDPSLLAARIDLAKSLISGNAAPDAIAILDGAPEQQKNAPSLLEQRSWALIATGQIAEARKAVDGGLMAVRS